MRIWKTDLVSFFCVSLLGLGMIPLSEQSCENKQIPCTECMETGTLYEGNDLEGFSTIVPSSDQCWYYCFELRIHGCSSFTFTPSTQHCQAKTTSWSTAVRVDHPNAVSGHLSCAERSRVPYTIPVATTTTTTTTTVTTTWGGSHCAASDPQYCQQYGSQKDHYCQQSWVQKYCKNLCGLCGVIAPTKTTTVVAQRSTPGRQNAVCESPDHSYCATYRHKKNHYCQQSWVKKHCKGLCGRCGNIRSSTVQPSLTRPVISTQRARSRCRSSDSQQCQRYRGNKYYYCQQSWVRTNCKNMCGECGGGPRPTRRTRRPTVPRRRPVPRRRRPKQGLGPEDYLKIDGNESYDGRATRRQFDSRLTDGEICVEDGNRYRRKHSRTKDLVYDQSLADAAQRYAQKLFPSVFNAYLRTGWRGTLPVVHDPDNRRYRWGENILIMSFDWKYKKEIGDLVYYCRKANKLWYDEIKDYDWARGWSRNGKQIGHYTQMVWRNTERVGYAFVTRRDPYKRNRNVIFALLVAKYQRPGNIRGQIIKNVGRVTR